MDSIYTYLLEFGSMGIFAAFLVWQHLSMQKRFDRLVDKFQEQLEKIRIESKVEVADIRGRYEVILQNYNEERAEIRVSLSGEMKECSQKIETFGIILGGYEGALEAIQDTQRENRQTIETSLAIIQEMKQEAKMIALAKEMAQTKE